MEVGSWGGDRKLHKSPFCWALESQLMGGGGYILPWTSRVGRNDVLVAGQGAASCTGLRKSQDTELETISKAFVFVTAAGKLEARPVVILKAA